MKNRKHKTSVGKNNFGENLGGGENKDTQTKFLKKTKLRIHKKKKNSLFQ